MISKSEIKKLATLARIDITEAEEEKFQHDLERILEYVDELKKANTDDLQPLARGMGLENVMQSDAEKPRVLSDSKQLLEAAPDHEGQHVRVRSVWK